MARDQITITEAAGLLGVSRQRVHALITEGKLKAERIGNQWVIKRSEVEKRLQQHAT